MVSNAIKKSEKNASWKTSIRTSRAINVQNLKLIVFTCLKETFHFGKHFCPAITLLYIEFKYVSHIFRYSLYMQIISLDLTEIPLNKYLYIFKIEVRSLSSVNLYFDHFSYPGYIKNK